MIDRNISDVEFARDFLGGKSAKTARRRILEDGIPCQRDHGRLLIRLSDAEAWREARVITPAAPNLKTLVAGAVQRARERRKAGAA